MAILNRILSILIVILAITAAVFSFLLFQRRQEFRGRADAMAKTISETAERIDRDSQTDYSADLTFTAATDTSPQSGTLSWQAYHEARDPETGSYEAFQERLDTCVEAGEALNSQRNVLAEKFSQTGITLGMGETDAQAADLRNLETEDIYESAAEGIVRHAEAVQQRDARMLETLASIGDTIDHPIDQSVFREREKQLADETEGTVQSGDFNVRPELSALEETVANLNARCAEYAETLSETLYNRVDRFSWSADPQQLADERNYAAALQTLGDDFRIVNQKLRELEITGKGLENLKEELTETEKNMIAARTELEQTKNRVKQLEEENKALKRGTGQAADQQVIEVRDDLRGEVLEVNHEWGFIVTDLGRGEINQGMELLVAQQDDFVARVKVTRIFPDVSVADIQPDIRKGAITVGDRLILFEEGQESADEE